jgi:hypothetical protein
LTQANFNLKKGMKMNTKLNPSLTDLFDFRVTSPQGTKSFENRRRAAKHVQTLWKNGHEDENIRAERRVEGHWMTDNEIMQLADKYARAGSNGTSDEKPKKEVTLKDALRQLSQVAKLSASTAPNITQGHIDALYDSIEQVRSILDEQ